MSNDDNCGSTNTYSGEPCKNPAGSCPIDAHDEVSADGGRPSKHTEDRREDILDAARAGTTVEGCARSAGIGTSTLYDWLDQYPEFSEAFNRARAKGERRLVEDVATEDPKFLLERSYDYTKKQELEHSGDGLTIAARFVNTDGEDE